MVLTDSCCHDKNASLGVLGHNTNLQPSVWRLFNIQLCILLAAVILPSMPSWVLLGTHPIYSLLPKYTLQQ